MVAALFSVALVLASMTEPVEGTLMTVETSSRRVMANVDRQFQTFPFEKHAVIERESSFDDQHAATKRIPFADLTPGEFVRLWLDRAGRVTHARSIVRLERGKVRSAGDGSVVLEDGRTITISTVLRFVDRRGRSLTQANVRPGETVLLFHHPQTGNVYRFSPEPRVRAHD